MGHVIQKNDLYCQLRTLPPMSYHVSTAEVVFQRRNRVKRIIKRRWNYLMNVLSNIKEKTTSDFATTDTAPQNLMPGDHVRVRTWPEIQSTLNYWNQLKRCGFMEEMTSYCGTKQRVFKRIEKFLDERDYLIKKCNGVVILENVFCEGTEDFGTCDRTCFFFWREEWLERI